MSLRPLWRSDKVNRVQGKARRSWLSTASSSLSGSSSPDAAAYHRETFHMPGLHSYPPAILLSAMRRCPARSFVLQLVSSFRGSRASLARCGRSTMLSQNMSSKRSTNGFERWCRCCHGLYEGGLGTQLRYTRREDEVPLEQRMVFIHIVV